MRLFGHGRRRAPSDLVNVEPAVRAVWHDMLAALEVKLLAIDRDCDLVRLERDEVPDALDLAVRVPVGPRRLGGLAALVSILGKLDEFQGLSRFTTWAYKFVVFEVSGKVAGHAWRRHPPTREELTFERLPDAGYPVAEENARADA